VKSSEKKPLVVIDVHEEAAKNPDYTLPNFYVGPRLIRTSIAVAIRESRREKFYAR
jgi:hypothetical protein